LVANEINQSIVVVLVCCKRKRRVKEECCGGKMYGMRWFYMKERVEG